jgi:hypothetical protein
MKITYFRVKENFADGGENGVADVAVLPRHGARQDAALEAIAHDQVVALAQLINESHRASRSYSCRPSRP